MHETTGSLREEPPVQVDELAGRRKDWLITRIAHIYPRNDLVEHTLFSTGCVCGAEVELRESGPDKGYVITHNALDGRE